MHGDALQSKADRPWLNVAVPEADRHREGGGSERASQLVAGVAFLKTLSYAGFEQQPEILYLNVELELKAEKEDATQFLADRKLFCDGRLAQSALKRVCLAAGAAANVELSADLKLNTVAILWQQGGAGPQQACLYTCLRKFAF